MNIKANHICVAKFSIIFIIWMLSFTVASLSVSAIRVSYYNTFCYTNGGNIEGWLTGSFIDGTDSLGNNHYNGYPDLYITSGADAIKLFDTAYHVADVMVCNSKNYGPNGCVTFSNPGCYNLINDAAGNFGFLKNNILSIKFNHYSTDTYPESCSAAGRVWFGQSGASNCCDPGDYILNAQSLCNGAYHLCGSGNIGEVQQYSGSSQYICLTDGTWKLLGSDQIDSFAKVCSSFVKGSSEAPSGDIFLTSSADLNKCCGNNGVKNAGFEGTVGWTLSGSGFSIVSASNLVPATSGTHYLKYSPLATAKAESDTIYVNLVKDDEITISGWIYRTGSTDAYIDSDLPSSCKASATKINTWEHVSCTQKADSAVANIKIRANAAGTSTVYFDDIHITGKKLDLGYVSSDEKNVCNFDGTNWKWQSVTSIPTYGIVPIDSNHDVVSNSQRWFSCDPNNPTTFTNPVFNFSTVANTLKTKSGFGGTDCEGDCGSVIELKTTASGQQPQPSVTDGPVAADAFLQGIGIAAPQSSLPITSQSGKAQLIRDPSQGYGAVNDGLIIKGENFNGTTIAENSIQLKSQSLLGTTYSTVHSEITISSKKFGTLSTIAISLPALSPGKYDVIIPTTGIDGYTYVFTGVYEVIAPPPGITLSLKNSYRFMCFNKGAYPEIAECAGNNYLSALNYKPDSLKDRVRRVGEVTTQIEEYTGPLANKNYVRRVLFDIAQPASGFIATNFFRDNNPSVIRDWSLYDNLEFDVYLSTTSEVYLRSYDVIPTDNANQMQVNDYKKQIKLVDFMIDNGDLNKWHHVIIPLSELGITMPATVLIYLNNVPADSEIFSKYSNHFPICLNTASGVASFCTSGQHSTLVGFDRIYLSKNSDLNSPNFCDFNGAWTSDLDGNSILCENTVATHWTGNRCCGDDQGRLNTTTNVKIRETFNDNNAGCWLGQTELNNSVAILDSGKNLLFYQNSSDSKFRSCILGTTSPGDLASLRTSFNPTNTNPAKNIRDEALCQNLGSWYCDSDSVWKNASFYSTKELVDTLKDNSNLDQNKFTTVESNPTSCCPRNWCWTGVERDISNLNYSGCVAPYDPFPKLKPIFVNLHEPGYRCNSTGGWVFVSEKIDYNGNDTGYCNVQSQCYANKNCYNDGQYTITPDGVDRMCINGNWTTRIKYLAYALLNYSESNHFQNYALYCDKIENSLGLRSSGTNQFIEIGYPIKNISNPSAAVSLFTSTANPNANQYLGLQNPGACSAGKCVNNFCILTFKIGGTTKTIAATSLNKALNTETYPLQEIFGFVSEDNQTETSVQNLPNTNGIVKIYESSKSGTLYYIKGLNTIFYTTDTGIPLGLTSVSFSDKLFYTIAHPIQSIAYLIQPKTVTNFGNVLSKISDFDRLYFAKNGDKIVTGFQEAKSNTMGATTKVQRFVAINYTGFPENIICAATDQYKTTTSRLNCTENGNSQYVYGIGSNQNEFDSVWPDLTAKIRIG